MKLHGLNQVLNAITFDEGAILKVLEESADNILEDANNRVNDAFIGSTLTTVTRSIDGGWIIDIGSNMELAGFVEWGTGSHVVVPPEVTSAYTMQWWKNGKGTLRAKPFLIPAWRIGAGRLASELNRELKRQFS